jgi:tRNA (Thr-GGU) A37 N-methylase
MTCWSWRKGRINGGAHRKLDTGLGAKDRPNRLGVTVCQIVKVEGSTVHVAGLDAIDGTPVVDIKPWMVEFGPRGDIAQPSWSTELMKGYW